MGQATTDLIRSALKKRYSYLPFWYTLFYEQEMFANLVMRPLWTEFTTEEATFAIDDEYLLGRSILVHPVTDQGATSVQVYFPGVNEVWYDADTFEKYTQNGNVKIQVDMEKVLFSKKYLFLAFKAPISAKINFEPKNLRIFVKTFRA